MGIKSDLQGIKAIEDTLTSNKVANFAYTDQAYTENDATGVSEYDVDNEQNIPVADASILNVNETILTKGWRSQASSVTRMLMNHFLGRISYNLNKVNDLMSSLLDKLDNAIGSADGIAPLNANGVLDYAYGGTNASTQSGAKVNLEINNVVNTGDSPNVSSGGTTKFTTGGAYNILTSFADIFSTSASYSAGDLVTYQNKFYECTSGHSAGAWNASHFTARTVSYLLKTYVLPALANVFSSTASYSIGDFVVYQNRLYRCTTNHSGAWNSSHFTLANLNSINDSIDNLESDIRDMIDDLDEGKADYTDLAPLFSTSTSYTVGDYVIYNYNLYRCTVAHSGSWNASNFTLVTVGSELKNKTDKGTIGVPSDSLLHYSFDSLPDLPDGTYVYKHNKDWTSVDWTRENTKLTFSIENKCLKAEYTSSTSGFLQAYRYNSAGYSGNFVIIRVKANMVHEASKRLYILVGLDSIGSIALHNGYNEYVFNTVNKSSTRMILQISNAEQGDTFIFEQFYIGNGNTTNASVPLLDNSGNGNNAVISNFVKTDGVTGKGGLFSSYSSSHLDTITISERNKSFSCWFSCNIYIEGTVLSNNSGLAVRLSSGTLYLDYDGTSTSVSSVSTGTIYHLAVVCGADDIKVYLDGVLKSTVSVTVQTIPHTIYVGALDSAGTTGFNGMIDDFQIFNRPLSAEEVTALYLNKANTPKFYDINNYNIENCDVASVGGSGKYIESVSQTDGKLSAVAQNLDTVPVQNSQKPVTSGALYNFFGGNTDYKAWLGKVFGWALGRNWTQGSGGENYNFTSITYNNNKWLACVAQHGIWYSDNGKSWTQASGGQSITFNAIIRYEGTSNIWVAGGTSSGLYYSFTEGSNWLQGDGDMHSITFYTICCVPGTGKVFAGSSSNGIWKSTDEGKTWSKIIAHASTSTFKHLIYVQDKDILVGASDSGLYYSSDRGNSWYSNSSSGSNSFYRVHYENGLFVASSTNAGIWYSENGIDWTRSVNTPTYCYDISYLNGVWVVVNGGSTNIFPLWWSIDGKNWSSGTGDLPVYAGVSTGIFDIYSSNNICVAASAQHGLWWSTDGKHWVQAIDAKTVSFGSVHYANGTWAAGSYSGVYYSDITNANIQ